MNNTSVDTCFVISPFGEPFDTYFSHIVKPALEECSLYAIRGDSLYRPTTIVDDIWQGIREAKLLVAELTDRNPNVFYELGLAHAISKPVILISKSIEDVPFDLRSIRVIVYDKDHPEWGSKLRENLVKAIREVLNNPTSAIPTTFKTPVKRDTPEEAETLMRLEALESMVHRLSDDLPFSQSFLAEPDSSEAVIVPFVGQYVFHKTFGRGEVLDVTSVEGDFRAQINFEKVGVKWIALEVAKMTILPS
jgi:hypothetical protein